MGLVLALFLDRYAVRSVLFNSEESQRAHPKGSTQNARTLEHFRRLGISEPVRRLGLPADHPTDVAYFARFNTWELARIRMPSEAEKMRAVATAPATDQVPEPILRANQMYVEAFLLDYARTRPNITLRFGWRVDNLAMEADEAVVEAERSSDGVRESWRASYVVGCDGGQSFVRRTLGARYRGFDALQQQYMGGRMIASHLRAPTLVRSVLRDRHAWQYWSVTPEAQLMLASLNGRDEFLVFSQPANDAGLDDATVATMVQRAAGVDVPLQMLGHRPWTGGVALVSERFGEGRVLLAGDAVHLFTPTGGFGMNTGIDDVANLSWKLAAMVHGWGGASLLELIRARAQARRHAQYDCRTRACKAQRIHPHITRDGGRYRGGRGRPAASWRTPVDVRRGLRVYRFAARRALRRLADHRRGWRAARRQLRAVYSIERPWRTRPAYLAGRAAWARQLALRSLGHRLHIAQAWWPRRRQRRARSCSALPRHSA